MSSHLVPRTFDLVPLTFILHSSLFIKKITLHLNKLVESYRYAKAQLCSLWVGTVRVDARGDASRSDNRGVVALVARQGEKVLGGQLDAQALQQLAVLRCEGVAQRHIVQLQVVTVL